MKDKIDTGIYSSSIRVFQNKLDLLLQNKLFFPAEEDNSWFLRWDPDDEPSYIDPFQITNISSIHLEIKEKKLLCESRSNDIESNIIFEAELV